eukprot:COSAG01_NODE_11840_length_1849_cov_1.579429_1_plen_249_part_00
MWQERMKEDQAFVVCNKMNAISVSTAPISRDEALQLIVDNDDRFQSKRMQTKSNEQKLERAREDYEDTTDAKLDAMARLFKKPDEGPTRRQVEEDVRGTVVRFEEAPPLGVTIGPRPGARETILTAIEPATHAKHPELRVGMIIRSVGVDEVPQLPVDQVTDQARQTHVDRVSRLLQKVERPLEIRFDGLFPKTREDSIHFVSANQALTTALRKNDEPEVFKSMRESLFQRLKGCVMKLAWFISAGST